MQLIIPYVSNPSSVKVPVLSKHIILILPATFILEGAIQKIFFFFSLYDAKLIPIDIQVGKAGGTVTVIISRVLSTISVTEALSFIKHIIE